MGVLPGECRMTDSIGRSHDRSPDTRNPGSPASSPRLPFFWGQQINSRGPSFGIPSLALMADFLSAHRASAVDRCATFRVEAFTAHSCPPCRRIGRASNGGNICRLNDIHVSRRSLQSHLSYRRRRVSVSSRITLNLGRRPFPRWLGHPESSSHHCSRGSHPRYLRRNSSRVTVNVRQACLRMRTVSAVRRRIGCFRKYSGGGKRLCFLWPFPQWVRFFE